MDCYPRLMHIHRKSDSYHARHHDSNGTFVATFKRSSVKTSIGLTIAGGIDKKTDPSISRIRQNSLAQRCEYFCIGDLLLEVNGQNVNGLTHKQIIDLVTDSGRIISFMIKPMPDMTGMLAQTAIILLKKQSNWERISVQGGFSRDSLVYRPITVHKILSKDSQQIKAIHGDSGSFLQPSDIILSINSKSVRGLGSCDVQQWLDSMTGDFTMEIQYCLNDKGVKHLPDGTIIVNIIKSKECSDWGISLNAKRNGDLIISSIVNGSPSDRHSALNQWDVVLGVGQVAVKNSKIEDVINIMRASLVSLELHIRPHSAEFNSSLGQSGEDTLSPQSAPPHLQPSYASTLPCRRPSLPYTISPSERERPRLNTFCSMTTNRFTNETATENDFGGQRVFNSSLKDQHLNSSARNGWSCSQSIASQCSQHTSSSGNSIKHTLCVDICCDSVTGLGFDVEDCSKVDPANHGLRIIYIHPNSDLARCGQVQTGDYLLSVDGVSIQSMESALNNCYVAESLIGRIVTLEIEFNIYEAQASTDRTLEFDYYSSLDHTIPTSGTFMVRLNVDTLKAGLILDASSQINNSQASTLRVRHIVKGTAAHRVGSILPGDELLTIDNSSFDGQQLEKAKAALVNVSGSVLLKLKKDVISGPSFTVELPTTDDCLSISLSGTEDPFSPIFIAGLAQQSEIQRCGGVFVGDRLLAINDISLRGYSLTEANQLLNQNNGQAALRLTLLRDIIDGSIGKSIQSFVETEKYIKAIDEILNDGVTRDQKPWQPHLSHKARREDSLSMSLDHYCDETTEHELTHELIKSPFQAFALSDYCKKVTYTTPIILKPIQVHSQIKIKMEEK